MDQTLPLRDFEAEIEELRRLNEELKNDLVESATVGQSILSRNNELEDQLREHRESYTKKQETLEQDNFVLRSKLETQTKLVDEQFLELERWKNDVQEAKKNKVDQDKLEALHSKVVERLEGEVAILQAEVDNARLVEAALQEKVERQAELLSQWKERDNSNSTFSGLESEVGALQSAVAALEKDKDTLTLKLHDVESQLKVLQSSDTASKAKVASLQEELDERIEDTNSLRTALQCANEKSVECAHELQMLKLEMMGEAAGQKGNSLFSEVEDRRLETEKRFISLKVKHESLEKAHSVAQQQLRKLKSNLQVYLSQRGQAAVDSGRVERLERAVASYRAQVEQLSQENTALKKDIKVAGPLVVKAPEVGATGKTVPRELADFLQYELERVRKECAELSSQLDQRKMEKLFDADKLRECEGRLNVVEAEAVKYHNEAAKCRQKLQEAIKKWRAEFTLREKLSQEVADLKAELECAKKSKGRKSLAPKLKDVVCTASKAGKPEDVGDFPSTTVKGSDRPTETRSSTSKEEEAGAEETPKAGEDKENSVNVDSAKMMEPCLQDGTKSKLRHSRPIVSEEVVNKCPQQ